MRQTNFVDLETDIKSSPGTTSVTPKNLYGFPRQILMGDGLKGVKGKFHLALVLILVIVLTVLNVHLYLICRSNVGQPSPDTDDGGKFSNLQLHTENVEFLLNLTLNEISPIIEYIRDGVDDLKRDLHRHHAKVFANGSNHKNESDFKDSEIFGTCKNWSFSYNTQLKKCYSFQTWHTVWFEAGEWCRRRGADLAAVESQQEMDFIDNVISGGLSWNRKSWWLGGYKVSKETSWTWTSTRKSIPPINSTEGFENWDNQNYHQRTHQSQCVCLQNRRWISKNCGEHKNFICEAKPVYLREE